MKMKVLRNTVDDLLHLFYPHVCAGCGTDSIGKSSVLCVRCVHRLPITNFHRHAENPVEKIFKGRIPVDAAGSFLYFSKDSLVQRLLHQLKYRGNKELGRMLGRMMGAVLKESPLFQSVDLLVPLPLHPAREKKRGYNQALILCRGMAEVWELPVCEGAVGKTIQTESQTHKNRIDRWQNMEGRFLLKEPASLAGKHILLVDDVVTTGATLEACGYELLQGDISALSIVTLAYAVK